MVSTQTKPVTSPSDHIATLRQYNDRLWVVACQMERALKDYEQANGRTEAWALAMGRVKMLFEIWIGQWHTIKLLELQVNKDKVA